MSDEQETQELEDQLTQDLALEEQTEAEPEEEPTEEPESDQTEPEGEEEKGKVKTVPYSEFSKTYGKLKRTERELERIRAEAQKPQYTGADIFTEPLGIKPKADDFDTYEDYLESLSEWNAIKVTNQYMADEKAKIENEERVKREKSFDERMSKGPEKWDDFIQTVTNEDVPINRLILDILQESEMPADIAYYLGKNPDEAKKIAVMSPFQAAKAIGKIEAKIEAGGTPPPKTTSKAPRPITSLSGTHAYERKLEEMSIEEFMKERDKREFGARK